jgi:uroporphyrinogen-III synthase
MRRLVTRPELEGAQTAAALRMRGHEVMLAPLLQIEEVAFALAPEQPGGVIMTSANAVRAVAAHPQRARLVALAAFTVGRHTADAAREAGFGKIHSADGDRNALVALIHAQQRGKTSALLYLAGEDRAGDLAGDLAAHGIHVLTVVAYRAVQVADFPAAVVAALARGTLDGVLHFSRRTAQAYLDCAARAQMLDRALRSQHFCLSRQVAEPLIAAGATSVRIAPHPDEAALIDVIGLQ